MIDVQVVRVRDTNQFHQPLSVFVHRVSTRVQAEFGYATLLLTVNQRDLAQPQACPRIHELGAEDDLLESTISLL